MKEAQLEALFFAKVKQAGGMAIKLMPTHAGVPDRLVLMPGGRMFLVELKTETGKVREIQKLWHQRARLLGTEVLVLRGRDEVLAWIAGVAVL